MVVITGYKFAYLDIYREIFKNAGNHSKLLVNSVLVLMMLSHLATTLVIVLQCQPVQKSWRPWIEGACLPNRETWIVS